MRDHYEVLQVHDRAEPDVIDRVYRLLARKYHPDVQPPEKHGWATRKMTEINVAYQVLSDAGKRAQYDRERGTARRSPRETESAVSDGLVAEATLKCFNHPRRSSVAFCWQCGRPICEGCRDEGISTAGGRTVCTTCVAYTRDLTIRMQAGSRARPDGEWWERPMGAWGMIVYYALTGALLLVYCLTVFAVAEAFGVHPRKAMVIAGAGIVVFMLMMINRLMRRTICPHCETACSRLSFRRIAPWKDFLSPHPICPTCGRHFLRQEVEETFE